MKRRPKLSVVAGTEAAQAAPRPKAPPTAAELIEAANAANARATKLADRAVDALFPAASRFEEDLTAIALLPTAKPAVRDRARRLALIIEREMEGIARLQEKNH